MAIVGLGPVGTTLALLLQQLGLHVIVVKRDQELCQFPRAAHFDDEVIRILQAVGLGHLADDMEPPTRYDYFDRNGQTFFTRLFPTGTSDQGYAYDHMFFQPDVEATARAALAARTPSPSLLLGYEVTRIIDTGDGVELHVADLAHGGSQCWRAAYVVGCDGARSLVRKTIESSFDELSPSQDWFIVDVELTDDHDPGLDQWEYCHPDRIVTYVPLSGPYRRFEFDLKPGETAEQLGTLDTAWSLLAPWVQPDTARILRHDVYRFHSLLADRWRVGRLLIAGDAAHLMSPKLGQGLCTGMRDVMNLAWKLARVARSESPATLLDSYEIERKQPAREYIEISAYMITQMIGHAAGDATAETDIEQIVLHRQRIGDNATRADDPFIGTLSPQPTLCDGLLLDDRVGYRFALLATADLDDAVRDRMAALDATIVVAADEPEIAHYLDDIERSAVLIRPDRYLAGVARNAPELIALLDRTIAATVSSIPATTSPSTH